MTTRYAPWFLGSSKKENVFQTSHSTFFSQAKRQLNAIAEYHIKILNVNGESLSELY